MGREIFFPTGARVRRGDEGRLAVLPFFFSFSHSVALNVKEGVNKNFLAPDKA